MGCCGEPAVEKPNDQYNNRAQPPYAPGVVNQQPGPHPGAQVYEKSPLLTPTGPVPPAPIHSPPLNPNVPGQAPWSPLHPAGSPPPPQGSIHLSLSPTMGGCTMSGMPLMPNAVYNPPNGQASPNFGGSAMFTSPPLLHPNPLHLPPRHASTSPSLPNAAIGNFSEFGNVAVNEGKMSISIDFGAREFICNLWHGPLTFRYRYYVLRCGKSHQTRTHISAYDSLALCLSGIRVVADTVWDYPADLALARFSRDVPQSSNVFAVR